MEYWNSDYPTHIEIPENYWIFSQKIEYSLKENNNE